MGGMVFLILSLEGTYGKGSCIIMSTIVLGRYQNLGLAFGDFFCMIFMPLCKRPRDVRTSLQKRIGWIVIFADVSAPPSDRPVEMRFVSPSRIRPSPRSW
ncbi:hypothetical protein GE09DRAFT_1117793 [Coniochaeta sp. 2T2.1]|nr:hypothetical protein GE09DRAFT_1117793 [Coniochaeta sp. 2T2.1]